MDVCLTFDVDFTAYTEKGKEVNEIEAALPRLLAYFRGHPDRRATWFVRVDRHMEATYGTPDYLLTRYPEIWADLCALGHEIGWHPHCYRRADEQWVQNTDPTAVLDEVRSLIPLIRERHGLSLARMGWGYQTNDLMACLSEAGFQVDSSALPRPSYAWERSVRDWESAPRAPYHPSSTDYRVPGRLPILEIPMSVTAIAAPYDAEPVERYVNLSFHPHLLQKPLASWMRSNDHLVTITHPYELLPSDAPHGLIAFDMQALERNVAEIDRLAEDVRWCTLSELAHRAAAGTRSTPAFQPATPP